MDDWQPINTAPKNAKRIEVMMSDGTIHKDCHYACDLSGECQPPFEGWFVPRGNGFAEVETPSKWRPIIESQPA